jgi:hypothetical protein
VVVQWWYSLGHIVHNVHFCIYISKITDIWDHWHWYQMSLKTRSFITRQYSKILTYTGLDRCWIIQYCGLSDGTYTDLPSKQVFFGTALVLWLYKLIRLLLLLFHLDCWFSVSILFCVFWSLHSLRWWSKRQGQEITTMVNVQTLWGAFCNVSLRSACVIDEALKLLILGLLSSQVVDYQDFWITGHWSKGILLYLCHMICLTF